MRRLCMLLLAIPLTTLGIVGTFFGFASYIFVAGVRDGENLAKRVGKRYSDDAKAMARRES